MAVISWAPLHIRGGRKAPFRLGFVLAKVFRQPAGASGRPVTWVFALSLWALGLSAQPFQLPTANHALFEKGGAERFFVGTVGKPWMTGTFGCVRSEGWQVHEGLDIRCLQRDKHGEPTDPVLAAADGTVAYISTRAGLSNYGKYLVIRHQVEGLEVYSLYAHLSEIRSDLRVG
ncbi:MAG TPA: M23 family metallopeptidase, partial [Candidatus Sulfotelmatobacter sp.]|nr:M23 family metallopeptidase [Candidatus Sulfotelmatobacter sp.]